MKLLFILGVMACSLQIFAQTGTSESAPGYTGRILPGGWTGYAGISSGYTANVDAIPVEGVPSSIKLLGSYYTLNDRGVFDVGVGAHNQTFIDAGAKDKSTSTTVMELAARYQTENLWQFGVVYNQFFDRGANYFSNQGDAMFGGLQLIKELNIGDRSNMRIGVRAMRDINTDNRDIDIAQLDLAWGFGPNARY